MNMHVSLLVFLPLPLIHQYHLTISSLYKSLEIELMLTIPQLVSSELSSQSLGTPSHL